MTTRNVFIQLTGETFFYELSGDPKQKDAGLSGALDLGSKRIKTAVYGRVHNVDAAIARLVTAARKQEQEQEQEQERAKLKVWNAGLPKNAGGLNV